MKETPPVQPTVTREQPDTPAGLPVLILVLAATLFAVVMLGASEPPMTRQVAGVTVEERVGSLSRTEEIFLHRLDSYMIPLPDTIRVLPNGASNGYYDKGRTIVLTSARHRSPRDEDAKPPYLYGRHTPTKDALPLPGDVHTLAHEIAHHVQWVHLNGVPLIDGPLWWQMGPTVSGPFEVRVETEADLIAAALEEIAFGMPVEALGYPKVTWAGRTDSLVRHYKGMIGDAYRIHNLP